MFVTTLGDALQDDIFQRQQVLHDLAVSIDMAVKSGQTEAARQLRIQFNTVKAALDRLIAQKKAQESPSDFSLGFANVGESLARTVRTYAIWGAVGIGLAIILPPLLTGAVTRRRNRR